MTWVSDQLKTAYLALSPTPATLEDAVAILTAQTDTITVDVPIQSVAAYIGLVGKLGLLQSFATNPPSGASAASVGAAQALWDMIQFPASFPPFAMTNPATASQIEAMFAALVSPGTGITGPLSSADQTQILALATQTVPRWQPAPTVGDLESAIG